MDNLVIIFLCASGLMLPVAVVYAIIGLSTKDDTTKNKSNAIASALFLLALLIFAIVFGMCVAMF